MKAKIKTENFFQKIILGLLFFFIFYIYLIFLPAAYNFDGTVFSHFLRYALVKNDVKPVLSLHHLLYYPFAFLSYKLFSTLFGLHMLEYYYLQLFSMFFGLPALFFIYKIFKALNISDFYKTSGVFFIAFSFLFWLFAGETEVHMPGFFFMTAGVYFLFFKPLYGGKKSLRQDIKKDVLPGSNAPAPQGTPLHKESQKKTAGLDFKNIVIAAFLLSLAAGFHLTNGLILFSALFFFIYEKSGIKRILQFYFSYAVFLGIPYLWLLSIMDINLIAVARDTLMGKSVFAGYTYTGTRFSRWRSLSFDSLSDSLGAIKESILHTGSSFPAIFSLLLFLIILITIIIYFLGKNGTAAGVAAGRQKIYYFIFWLAPFFLFFTFWQPENYEFKLNVVVPLLIMFVFSAANLKRQKIGRAAFPVLCALVFFINLFTAVKPMNNIDNNKNYLLCKTIEEKTAPASSIVIAGKGKNSYLHGKIYIPYFAMRETIVLDWRLGKGFSLQQVAAEIAAKIGEGRAVYFLSEVSSLTETMKDILSFHKKRTASAANERGRNDFFTKKNLHKKTGFSRISSIKESDYLRFLERMEFSQPIDIGQGYHLLKVESVRPVRTGRR
ncbi:MAG: hypothetical protein KAW12_12485 [Candidatus Aminicenantes bacterium]|nr:hypothetical protein [Candidatus Aminicenantes bacterium]